ncbi:hypothetical protein F443_23114 [Phytophthora nicotianae P1569]|uniref:Uncharacterized protein n=1 Tax=Phytophthora nicotianae P1569 TaxID=1317065 RepID=V9DSA8_PHYNI|nr:hypothetical protein F443_23114 [Phytophthora nicotianae P1569]
MSFEDHETRTSFEDHETRTSFGDSFRRTRSKPVTETLSVTQRSLDQAWTAFVLHWNAETGPPFRRLIEARKETHERLSVAGAAARVCKVSWAADRLCCYAHYLEGCAECRKYGLPRPTEREWSRFLVDSLLSDEEQSWIGHYRRALHEACGGSLPQPIEDPPCTRQADVEQHRPRLPAVIQ